MSLWSDAVAALSPYLWWKLDETTGTVAADASGNGLAGTYSSATLNQTGLIPGDPGGKSITLASTSANVQRTSGMSYPNVGVTYAQTFKSATDFTSGRFFSGSGGFTYLGFGLTNMVAALASGISPSLAYDPSNLCDGNPHFIVYVVRTATVELWVDGTMVASAAHAASAATMTSLAVKQGFANPTGSWDDVLVWTSALSSAQIGELSAAWSGVVMGPELALAGTQQPDTAAFAGGIVGDVALAGTQQRDDAEFVTHVDTPAVIDLAGVERRDTLAVNIAAEGILDLAGTQQPDAAVFEVDVSKTLTLAGTQRRDTAAFVLATPPTVTLGGVERRDVATFALAKPPASDTSTRLGGRDRTGYASATWDPPIVPPPAVPALVGAADANVVYTTVSAAAFGPVTITGPQPTYTVSSANKTRMRHRVLVGGKDVSFLHGVATPEPPYMLAEPLRWGPCTIELPQIPAAFANPGVGDLAWCAKGKKVVLQRVNDVTGTIVATGDYRGVVVGYDVSGPNLRLEIGGDATGRAALRHRPAPIFRHVADLGHWAWEAIQTLGLKFEPKHGPETGIRSRNFGGSDWLTYVQEICAKAWDRDGTQWTIRPSDSGVYRMIRKDTETVDFTIFTDDTRAVPSLRSDAAEEPNRIFGTGVTPKGQRVRFGVYPGLKPGQAARYPFDDDRVFGTGTTDEDTDTGDGITIMLRRLWHAGYLSLEDQAGTYDADVKDAISDLQEDAFAGDGAVVYSPGVMTPDTWAALFDVDVTGFDLNGSRVEPAAQATETRRYKRSASGAILKKNPGFDPHVLISDRELDFGTGFTRHRMRKWSRAEIARGQDNWVGTITIKTGAVLHGAIAPGTTVTADDLADVRAIEPGTNAWLPTFAGGILVHISAVEISYDAGVPQATLTVDTQARDAMAVWEIIRRDRESRRDPARRWHPNRASGEIKDAVTPWDEVGGVLYDDVKLQRGWNVVPVVAGQEGTVSRLRLLVQTSTVDGTDLTIRGHEFACAVFGGEVTAERLKHLIGNPLAAAPDSTKEPTEEEKEPPAEDAEKDAETGEEKDPANEVEPVRPWWERKAIRDELRDLGLLYSAGTRDEPCGYSPGRKSANATRTGMHRADAGFSYRTGNEPVLYLAVWVWGERTLTGGRVMWPQLEAGA